MVADQRSTVGTFALIGYITASVRADTHASPRTRTSTTTSSTNADNSTILPSRASSTRECFDPDESGSVFELQEERRTQFIHRGGVGRLRYVAAYAPFTDERGNITGYLHLPYFEKQNELNQEISGFISALLNIYVLLFAIALFYPADLARITQPLSVLQEKLAGIRLGRRNEEIAYSGTDEIGALVNEYNRLVAELAISADKLARSERESAWREMARQVAHEIKTR